MQKVEMFRTFDGAVFDDEDKAVAHEKSVKSINKFRQRYEECHLYGEGSAGRVSDDQLIQWARENPLAFRALCSAVLGGDE